MPPSSTFDNVFSSLTGQMCRLVGVAYPLGVWLASHLHRDSDPHCDPDWLHLHGGILDSNPAPLHDMDCDPWIWIV